MTPSSEPDRPAALSRRDALRKAAVAGGTLAAARAVHAQSPAALSPSTDVIRVGVIGCGGRGIGALQQTLSVPGSNVKLTALADAFEDRIQAALKGVESMKDKLDCPEDRRFKGLDGYRNVIENCDLVILATPPGFRPYHFDAAVRAGRHVFMEKPICIDSFGARLCMEAAKMAEEKKLKVVVGLQRRYDDKYRQTVARVREGLAGDIIGGQIFWNGDRPWFKNRKPGMSELEYQIYNWGHFNWLCGDHIVEQHVHNIDVANWFLDRLPETAYGIGGQQNRKPSQSSEIYDHHTVDFTYPGGVHIASQCRQFPGGENRVREEFQGTKGFVRLGEITDHAGKLLWKYEGKAENPYQVEHNELHDAIRTDRPLNNGFYGATSSFSAVLGRYATYTGKQWSYEQALALPHRLMPENLTWETPAPVLPDKDGIYKVAMPADYKIV